MPTDSKANDYFPGATRLTMLAILAEQASIDANLAGFVVTGVGLLLVVAWLLGLYR